MIIKFLNRKIRDHTIYNYECKTVKNSIYNDV
jgi:hypothetical protein